MCQRTHFHGLLSYALKRQAHGSIADHTNIYKVKGDIWKSSLNHNMKLDMFVKH